MIIKAETAVSKVIVELSHALNSQSDVMKTTGYAMTTVYQTVARVDSTVEVERSYHNPRKDKKLTKTFLVGLKMSVRSEPNQY